MTPNDPADHALSEHHHESRGTAVPASGKADGKADGYTKTGPGPLAAVRIKWTARAIGHITYVVDETVGDSTAALTSAPMSLEAAIQYIDEHEHAARERFEQLRSELAWPRPVVPDEATE